MAITYVAIATTTVGSGGASSIDFTSIPSIYTDLVVKISARTNRSGTSGDALNITFNGSSTAVYSEKTLRGDGASATSFNETNVSPLYGTRATSAGNTASTFSNNEIYIPNYAGSNNKSVSVDGVTETNATTAYAELTAGLWANTAAITSITIAGGVGTFQQYTTATLYGILKA